MMETSDRGLLLGDGLFETVLLRKGRLVWLDAHLVRLTAGCAELGLPAPDLASARQMMREAIVEAGLQETRAAVRLTLTAGVGGRGLDRPAAPALRMFATASAAPRPEGPVRAAWTSVRRNEGSPASRLKTLAYIDNVLARAEAQAVDADEALMLNNRGEAACAAAANLFWIASDRLFTPALECGVLAGIARARVIESARAMGVEVVEARAGAGEVRHAQAAFITNSLVGVRPVSNIDGDAVGESRLTEALSASLG